jgi:hypothetical protein
MNTTQSPDFDFSKHDLGRRPSWLLNDIHVMMRHRMGEMNDLPEVQTSSSLAKRLRRHKRLPDNPDMYKNLQKEKAPPPTTGEKYAKQMKKTKVDVNSVSLNEEKVNEFLNQLSDKRKKKKEEHVNYMTQSQRPPSPTPYLTSRFASTTRPNTAILTSLKTAPDCDVVRPQTAPGLSTHASQRNLSALASSKSRRSDHFFPGTDNSFIVDTQENAAKCLRIFAKAAGYYEKMRLLLLLTKAETLRRKVASRKIRNCIMMYRHRRRQALIAMIPPIFMHYLRRFRKKYAVNVIITFLGECSSMQSSTIVKKYLLCVRKCQKLFRDCLAVRAARRVAMRKLWERNERQYRRLFEEHEKEMLLRLQKERANRLGKSGSHNVHDKWDLTNQQVW